MRLAIVSSAVFIGSTILNCFCSKKWLKIKEVKITSSKINKPFKILHISDLHSNSEKKMNLNIWKKIDNLDFSIAVITGDVILSKIEELTPHLKELEKLSQRVPVFFVDGNHDVFYVEELKNIFESYNIMVLYNVNKVINIKNNIINIVGLRDYYFLEDTNFKSLNTVFKDLDSKNFTVVLSHQPQIIRHIKNKKIDLILSGHTHGGQIRLPFFPTIFAPGQGLFPKYGDGLYNIEDTFLYVSRGVGTTYFPFRFFNRAEISIINIVNK